MPHTETFIDGVWHPSVTTVMGSEKKPWLDAWGERWGDRAVRKKTLSAAIGQETHRCIEEYIQTGTYTVRVPTDDAGRQYPSLVARVTGMMKSFEAWAATTEGEIYATEQKVISRKHVYSGTVDAIGKINKDDLGLENGKIPPARRGNANQRLRGSGGRRVGGESTIRKSGERVETETALPGDGKNVQIGETPVA